MVATDRLTAVLTRFARAMSDSYDLTEVLYRLTDDVTEVLDVAGAGIAVADAEDVLRYATASSEAVATLERVQEEHQLGPCAEAFRSQEPVTVTDIADRADWPAYRSEAQRLGFHAVAGVPLSLASERFGALNLYDHGPREWTPEDIGLARILADVAAGYLVQARLEDSRRLAEQLQYALATRVVIEQAKGVLSVELGVSVDEAFDRLRRAEPQPKPPGPRPIGGGPGVPARGPDRRCRPPRRSPAEPGLEFASLLMTPEADRVVDSARSEMSSEAAADSEDVVVLMTIEEVDAATVPAFAAELDSAMARYRSVRQAATGLSSTLVIDLRQVRFLDSKGLQSLLDVHREAVAAQGRIRLDNAEGVVLRVLEITGTLDHVNGNGSSPSG